MIRPDKHLWLALALAAAVIIPRSVLIMRAQSERVDDEYHLIRGIQYLKRHLNNEVQLPLNDPPLGEGITALPLWLARCWPKGAKVESGLWGYRLSADHILILIGIWKSLLFLPAVAVIFIWCRKVYGLRAAWLALALVLVDPTLAAHIPLPTLDALGVEGILIACFLLWRYFEKPNLARLIAAAVAIGVAMMLKHTAVILPGVAIIYGSIWWFFRRRDRTPLIALISMPLIIFMTIWALCFFDFERPPAPQLWSLTGRPTPRILQRRLPACMYIGSFVEAHEHAGDGHPSYLFGAKRKEGVWYYFPVVATYKIPLGIAAIMLLALISLWKVKPKWDELSLLIPMLAWTALMLSSKINIGFRHFLPAYVFMMMLAARSAMVNIPIWTEALIFCVGVTVVQMIRCHPDYLSYINFPRHKAYLQISDSNVDWGQGLKAARAWILQHPGRQVFVRDFGWGVDRMKTVRRRIGDIATPLDRGDPLPRGGVLSISPVPVAGVYERSDPFRILRTIEPDAVLAHSMLVYDLDRLRKDKAFTWPKYKPPPVDEHGNPRPAAPGSPNNANPRG